MIAEVTLPLEDSELDAREYDEERREVGGYGAGQARVNIIQQVCNNPRLYLLIYLSSSSCL